MGSDLEFGLLYGDSLIDRLVICSLRVIDTLGTTEARLLPVESLSESAFLLRQTSHQSSSQSHELQTR